MSIAIVVFVLLTVLIILASILNDMRNHGGGSVRETGARYQPSVMILAILVLAVDNAADRWGLY